MNIQEILEEFEERDPGTEVVAEVFDEHENVVSVVILGVRFEDDKMILETEHP